MLPKLEAHYRQNVQHIFDYLVSGLERSLINMEYTKIDASREDVRDEILDYLRTDRVVKPFEMLAPSTFVSQLDWVGRVKRIGRPIQELINEVWAQLESAGKLRRSKLESAEGVLVLNSIAVNWLEAYYALSVKTLIFEELMRLVRMGVLIEIEFEPDFANHNVYLKLGEVRLVLTEYGTRFVHDVRTVPFETKQYLNLLRQSAEPADELQAYLSEGLACLEYNLTRGAAVLLRLAVEHVLELLSSAIVKKLESEDMSRSAKFETDIKAARTNIEKRAEVIFQRLYSDVALLANSQLLRARLEQQLKPSVHGIRELGGEAAHLNNVIDGERVNSYYRQFPEQVYKIAMHIVKHIEVL